MAHFHYNEVRQVRIKNFEAIWTQTIQSEALVIEPKFYFQENYFDINGILYSQKQWVKQKRFEVPSLLWCSLLKFS